MSSTHSLSIRLRPSDLINRWVVTVRPEVLALRERRGAIGTTDSVNYVEYGHEYSGRVSLIGRIKSHPDVAERHYPQLFREFFPQGINAEGGSGSGY